MSRSCCRKLIFLAVVTCFINALPAHAQQVVTDSLNAKELDSIIIKSGRSSFSLTATTPVQTLTGSRLQQLNSFSVADALRYFSGVQLKDYGGVGGIKTINVRNMGTQHVAVMLDGIRIVNAQNGTVDLGKYSLDNIETIQLFNGGSMEALQPALNQFASSAIYLQTKRPLFLGTEQHHYQLSLKTGSFGLLNPAFLWQQKISDAVFLSTSAEMVTANGEYKYRYTNGVYDTTATRRNGAITAVRLESFLLRKIRTIGEAFLKVYYYGSNRGLPGAIVANKYYSPQHLWDKNFFVQASYKNSFDRYSLVANTKLSIDYTKYFDPDFIMTTGPLTNIYKQKEGYASVAQGYQINRWWQLALSTDFSVNTLDANLYRFPYPTRYSYIGAFNSNFNWNRLSANAGLLGASYKDAVKQYQAGQNQSALSPAVSISWQPVKNFPLRLRSFYKESLRMPTFNDLYYTQIGNTFLQPEYTRQLDAGFTWLPATLSSSATVSLQADVYYNKVSNKIVAVPAANLFRWMMLNLGKVAIKGVDVTIGFVKKIGDSASVNAGLSYTWQQAINKTAGESSFNQQIPYTPENSGSLHGSFSWRSWLLNGSFIYTGSRYVLPDNIPVNYMQPWYTTDIGLQKNSFFSGRRLLIGVEVNNLFNQYYDVVLNFPMPGRNYRLTISINY